MTDLRNEIEDCLDGNYLHDEFADYLGLYLDDYDVDAIESALRGRGVEHVDQCDPDEFNDLVQRHDVSAARQ